MWPESRNVLKSLRIRLQKLASGMILLQRLQLKSGELPLWLTVLLIRFARMSKVGVMPMKCLISRNISKPSVTLSSWAANTTQLQIR